MLSWTDNESHLESRDDAFLAAFNAAHRDAREAPESDTD